MKNFIVIKLITIIDIGFKRTGLCNFQNATVTCKSMTSMFTFYTDSYLFS